MQIRRKLIYLAVGDVAQNLLRGSAGIGGPQTLEAHLVTELCAHAIVCV